MKRYFLFLVLNAAMVCGAIYLFMPGKRTGPGELLWVAFIPAILIIALQYRPLIHFKSWLWKLFVFYISMVLFFALVALVTAWDDKVGSHAASTWIARLDAVARAIVFGHFFWSGLLSLRSFNQLDFQKTIVSRPAKIIRIEGCPKMKKKWITIVLAGVFLYWALPTIFSNQISSGSTPRQLVIDRYFLSWKWGKSVYSRSELESVVVRYQKAYFDLKMRALYHVGIKLRSGTFILLKELSTTLQYEVSLAYAPDKEIKHRQALEFARAFALRLSLPIQDEVQA